mgnify:CR=1 FL=1
MRTRKFFTVCMIQVIVLCFLFVPGIWAADPIVIGVPTSTGFLEGKECLKSVQMAVEEINKLEEEMALAWQMPDDFIMG